MLKKNFLLSLVIFQGILIVIAIIAIIIGVFYKFSEEENLQMSLSEINVEEISLLDENHYQHKIIKDDKIIFQIIDIENLSNLLPVITLEQFIRKIEFRDHGFDQIIVNDDQPSYPKMAKAQKFFNIDISESKVEISKKSTWDGSIIFIRSIWGGSGEVSKDATSADIARSCFF